MADPNIEILKKDTFLKMLENSAGSRMFNSLFVRFKDSNEKKDVLNDGEFSCAFFVSGILYMFEMTKKPVSTVKNLKEQIETSEMWNKVEEGDVQEGDLVFWQKVKFEDGSENAHVGFAVSGAEAISTDYKLKAVNRHLISARPIDQVYRFRW